MREDEMAAMAAELPPIGVDGGDGETVPVEVEPIPEPDPGVIAVLQPVTLTVGNLVCRRASVTPLEASEAEALARALALLVEVYNVKPGDPRALAWWGLGATAAAIMSARQPLIVEGEAREVAASA